MRPKTPCQNKDETNWCWIKIMITKKKYCVFACGFYNHVFEFFSFFFGLTNAHTHTHMHPQRKRWNLIQTGIKVKSV